MHRSIWVLLICVAPVGCHFEECWDDDGDWDEDHCGCDDEHGSHGTPGSGGSASGGAAGASPTGNMTGTGGQSDVPDAGGAPSAGGSRPTTPPPPPPPTSCSKEADCAPGFNCDFTQGKCTPSDAETCGELVREASCGMRTDCKMVYAGVNCSCGPDCHCIGGEAGCICESFEFFRCEPADPPVKP